MRNDTELRKIVRMTKEANEQRAKAHAKEVFKQVLTKKFKTTMIGSLHQFEKFFGDLWGHDIVEEDLTEEELEWRRKWELARLEILNNGNDQLRNALAEADHYSMSYEKNRYEFPIKDKKGFTENE